VPRPAVTSVCAWGAPNASTAVSAAGVWAGGATGGTAASWPIDRAGELWLWRSRCADAAAGIRRWCPDPPKRSAGSTRGSHRCAALPPYWRSGAAHGPQRTLIHGDAAACPTLPPARRPSAHTAHTAPRPPHVDRAAGAFGEVAGRPRLTRPLRRQPPRGVPLLRDGPGGALRVRWRLLGRDGPFEERGIGQSSVTAGVPSRPGLELPCRLGATAPRGSLRGAPACKGEEGETPGRPLVPRRAVGRSSVDVAHPPH